METHYCINCNQEASELHHVVPLALGGNDIDSNKVWLCTECHSKIHNRNLSCGQLGGHCENFRKAVAEGRVGKRKAQLTEKDKIIFQQYIDKKINGSEAIRQMSIGSTTFYKYKEQWIKELTNN